MKLSTLLCLTLLIIGIMTLPVFSYPCNEIDKRDQPQGEGSRGGGGKVKRHNECDRLYKRNLGQSQTLPEQPVP
ncbi:hypothetical protein Glove_299g27 [Diversispora epigaea]|uniref:Uncharacterized protein n=1 Tax=Diversispora epigaea TaxID=1348612 RepID=A0A397HX07_9GLOM|nr:hypothetical protein Glove_299g27 [Diversispora epigaea]